MPLNILKRSIQLPEGVAFDITSLNVATLKGPNGVFSKELPMNVSVNSEEGLVNLSVEDINDKSQRATLGLVKSLISGGILGVTTGFVKALEIKGVGYRAIIKGKDLSLSLGFSHPVDFPIPEGITLETPSQTEVLVKGVDKCLVGQVAANIRRYRPVERYKGKGIRYKDEVVIIKETKKK
tara:strand:- start:24870 stop:25412 length:543 start_codon:yes stop_codon:yes gene_type:complete